MVRTSVSLTGYLPRDFSGPAFLFSLEVDETLYLTLHHKFPAGHNHPFFFPFFCGWELEPVLPLWVPGLYYWLSCPAGSVLKYCRMVALCCGDIQTFVIGCMMFGWHAHIRHLNLVRADPRVAGVLFSCPCIALTFCFILSLWFCVFSVVLLHEKFSETTTTKNIWFPTGFAWLSYSWTCWLSIRMVKSVTTISACWLLFSVIGL